MLPVGIADTMNPRKTPVRFPVEVSTIIAGRMFAVLAIFSRNAKVVIAVEVSTIIAGRMFPVLARFSRDGEVLIAVEIKTIVHASIAVVKDT